jgi:hypothetical protein
VQSREDSAKLFAVSSVLDQSTLTDPELDFLVWHNAAKLHWRQVDAAEALRLEQVRQRRLDQLALLASQAAALAAPGPSITITTGSGSTHGVHLAPPSAASFTLATHSTISATGTTIALDHSFASTGDVRVNYDGKLVRGLSIVQLAAMTFILRLAIKPERFFDGKEITVNFVRDQLLDHANALVSRGNIAPTNIPLWQLDMEKTAASLTVLEFFKEDKVKSIVGLTPTPPRIEWFFVGFVLTVENCIKALETMNTAYRVLFENDLRLFDDHINILQRPITTTETAWYVPFVKEQINSALKVWYYEMRIRRGGLSPTDPPMDLSIETNWRAEWISHCSGSNELSLELQLIRAISKVVNNPANNSRHDTGTDNIDAALIPPGATGNRKGNNKSNKSNGLPLASSAGQNSNKVDSSKGSSGANNRDVGRNNERDYRRGINDRDNHNRDRDANRKRGRSHEVHRHRSHSARDRDRSRDRRDKRSRERHDIERRARDEDFYQGRRALSRERSQPDRVKIKEEAAKGTAPPRTITPSQRAKYDASQFLCVANVRFHLLNPNHRVADCPGTCHYSHNWRTWGAVKTLAALDKVTHADSLKLVPALRTAVTSYQGWYASTPN